MPAFMRFQGRTSDRVQTFLSAFKSSRLHSFLVDGNFVLCDGLPCAEITWEGDTDIPVLTFLDGYTEFQEEFELIKDFQMQVEALSDRPVWSEAAYQDKLKKQKPSNVLNLRELNIEDFLDA